MKSDALSRCVDLLVCWTCLPQEHSLEHSCILVSLFAGKDTNSWWRKYLLMLGEWESKIARKKQNYYWINFLNLVAQCWKGWRFQIEHNSVKLFDEENRSLSVNDGNRIASNFTWSKSFQWRRKSQTNLALSLNFCSSHLLFSRSLTPTCQAAHLILSSSLDTFIDTWYFHPLLSRSLTPTCQALRSCSSDFHLLLILSSW